MTKSISCLFIYMVLLPGLTMTVVGQPPTDYVDAEIANAPVDPTLAAMNQVPLRIGASEARVTQLALMVKTDYPPGQPTLYVADRTLRLPTQFVSSYPRRRTEEGLEWTFDTRRAQALTLVNGIPQILTPADAVNQTRLAVNSWISLPCYAAYFAETPYPLAPGFENIEWVDDFYLGAEPQRFRPVAEVTVGGFLPASFFRQTCPASGDNILGVAYQFAFYDRETGRPTDIDRNGKLDGFWSEIYFNALHYWGDATAPGVDPFSVFDLQTVALHESGHTFGLGHFGHTFQNHGGFQVAGYNIMSQVYPGPVRTVSGIPTATFCGLYDNWH
jgi:hypothetical protein